MVLLASGVPRPLAPQAFAEVTPQFYNSFFAPKIGVQLADSYVTYGVMYQTQNNVFACVDKIATLIARLDVMVYNISDPDNTVIDHDSDYAKLMMNPALTVDPYHFYHWLATTYEVYGEAFLLKNRNETGAGSDRRRVKSLIPMHPTQTEIHRAEDGTLLYRFMGHPNELIPEAEVVPFRRYNPMNTMRGLSRLEPLRLTLMNEDGARRAQSAWWDKMCRPSMVLSTPKKLGDNGRKRLQAAVTAANQSADNAGGTLVLEDEVTATRMQLGPEEMQYTQSRLFNREEVCSIYDIPPAAVQYMSMADVGIASYLAVLKDVYKYSIDHRLKAIESVFAHHLASENAFGNGDKEFRFNVARQLRGDVESLAPAAVQLVQSGIAKPKEMREWFELDDAGDVADALYANQALKLLGTPQISYTESGMQPPPEANALPNPNATNVESPSVTGDLPKQVPALTDKAKAYVNAARCHMGRGENLVEPVSKWLNDNPGDFDDVQSALVHVAQTTKGIR